ncbi:Uncharacterised protein [Citrobacter braakii]|nr:Uncharacterised protein [Citrobacter braakii]
MAAFRFATIPGLINAGAENLVLGSTSLYRAGYSLAENRYALDELIKGCGRSS